MPFSRVSLAAIMIGCGTIPPSVAAAQAERIVFDLPAQPLERSLRQVALQAGRSIVAPTEVIAERAAPPLVGSFTVEEAVAVLLSGSGLTGRLVGASVVVGPQVPVERSTDEPGARSEIVVTGTRIRGEAAPGTRVVTLDRRAIERSGYATSQDLLQSLPQNYAGGPNEAVSGIVVSRDGAGLNQTYGSAVNLRGLGPASTLVLLDGVRPALGGFSGVFSDLSIVPLTAVERIEVVPDGASAIYGSDAVAGVVNVITRRRADGLEARVRSGTADGDASEFQVGLLGGTGWSGGWLSLAYEFYRRDRLAARDRAFATEDLRLFGGPDYRSDFASPGTIVVGGRSFAIPAGQDGTALTSAQLTPGVTNRSDRWLTADLLPRQERHSVFASAEQDLGATTTLFGRLLLAERRFDRRDRPSLNEPIISVPVTNPFYVNPLGTTVPVSVRYAFTQDLGSETSRGFTRAASATAGVRQGLGDWRAEVFGTYGVQRERATTVNVVNTARLAAALADPSRATAYNVFGDGNDTDPATVERIRGSTSSDGRYVVWSGVAKVDGPLFRLPAGPLRVAFGGEHREERFVTSEDIVDRSTLLPQSTRINDLPGTRRIDAGFAELLVPIFGGDTTLPALHRLDLSLAGRIEHYSDFGTTSNPKVGLGWQPLTGISVRASYGTSFRAPSFNNLRQGPSFRLIFPIALADPTAPGGRRNVLVQRGNDPDIGPERAETWTLGADFTPAFAPGLTAAVTWFDVRYRDRIADPSADLQVFLVDRARFAPILNESITPAEVAALYADPSFLNPFAIPASAVGVYVDARTQNLSVSRQSGIDFQLGYARAVAGGRLLVDLSGSYLTRYDQRLTATAPAVRVVGTYGFPTRFRGRGTAGWSKGPFEASASGNLTGRYRNTLGGGDEPVPAWVTIDARLSYGFGSGGAARDTTLSLVAINVLDRDPPYVRSFNGLTAVGFDPQAANPLGRLVSVEFRKRW